MNPHQKQNLRPVVLEQEADGKLVDAIRNTWDSTTSLSKLRFLQPDNGAPVKDRVVLVNGIMTDLKLHYEDMQALANTGAEVIGVHNGTYGIGRDLKECIYDLMNKGHNPAVETVKDLIRSAVDNGEELHLVGHSQGAIIISRALRNIVAEHKAAGESPVEIEKALSNIKVETYGGGAAYYVDGPQYVHLDNWLDPVPFHLGVGFASKIWQPGGSTGKGAVQHTFSEVKSPFKRERGDDALAKTEKLARYVDYSVHGPQDIYFPRRKSFDEMRQGVFG